MHDPTPAMDHHHAAHHQASADVETWSQPPADSTWAVHQGAPYPYPYAATTVGAQLPRRNANPVHVTIAWIFAIITLGYLLPWAIAATRAKSNSLAIAVLNLFVGWTVIGWIIALVMACSTERQVVVQSVAFTGGYAPYPPPPGYGPAYRPGPGHPPAQQHWQNPPR